MKKYGERILALLLCALLPSGCFSPREAPPESRGADSQAPAPASSASASPSSAAAESQLPEESEAAEEAPFQAAPLKPWEEISYREGGPQVPLSQTDCVLTYEMFNEAVSGLYELYDREKQREDSRLLVPTADLPQAGLQLLPGPEGFGSLHVPVECGGLLYFRGTVDPSGEGGDLVIPYDGETRQTGECFSAHEEGMSILSLTAGENTLYWLEADRGYTIKDPSWRIYAQDMEEGSPVLVDSSENYGESSMIPMLQAHGERLAYVVGDFTVQEGGHYVRLYEKGGKPADFSHPQCEKPLRCPCGHGGRPLLCGIL